MAKKAVCPVCGQTILTYRVIGTNSEHFLAHNCKGNHKLVGVEEVINEERNKMHKTDVEKDHPWVGHFNDPPANLRVITEDEFWGTFSGAFGPRFYFIKQVIRGLEDIPEFTSGRADLTLYMFHGNRAVGWVRKVEHALVVRPTVFVECFECDHEMVSIPTSTVHLHVSQCRKCGYRTEVDSS